MLENKPNDKKGVLLVIVKNCLVKFLFLDIICVGIAELRTSSSREQDRREIIFYSIGDLAFAGGIPKKGAKYMTPANF